MSFEFVASEKGKPQLLKDGYIFYKDSYNENNGNTYWKCVHEYNTKQACSARLTTSHENKIIKESNHNHGGNAAKVQAMKVRNELKENALNTSESPHVLIATASGDIHDSVSAYLPSMSSLKRTIRNVRNVAADDVAHPLTRKDIELPAQFRVTEKNHDFVLYDNGPVDNRMLIFGTVDNLRLLAESKHWFMDGTIGACSSLFAQLYSIHALVDGKIVPSVFGLLAGKSSAVYEEMFTKLKEANPNLTPESVMLDMEQAAVKALCKTFPNVKIRFCNFHFGQALYRKIVSYNMKTLYDTEVEFSQKVKLLAALAFVKPDDVIDTFNRIVDEVFVMADKNTEEFLDSFEAEFVARYDRRRNIKDAQFPVRYWNHYNACISNLPRTNNSVEGWHRGFNEIVRQKHPTIWNLIRCFKIEQSRNELIIAELRNAVPQPPPAKKYRDLNERIRTIVLKYDDPLYKDRMEYLKAIANNIAF